MVAAPINVRISQTQSSPYPCTMKRNKSPTMNMSVPRATVLTMSPLMVSPRFLLDSAWHKPTRKTNHEAAKSPPSTWLARKYVMASAPSPLERKIG